MVSKTVLFVEFKKLGDEMDRIEQDDSAIEKAKKLVAREHQKAFEALTKYMEADLVFLAYWEQDENCQKAVRQAIEPMINIMEIFVQKLKALVT